MLDVAFQSVFVARAHPASRQITSIFLPAHIDRVRVTPSAQMLQSSLSDGHVIAEFEAWVVAQTTSSLSGDLNICSPETGQPFLQVEGFVVKTVGEPDADHDRPVFAKTVWARDVSLGLADPVRDAVKDIEALHKTEVTERFALFYMRRVVEEIRVQDRTGFQWYHDRMFEAFEHRLAAIRDGQNTLLPSRWLADEPSVIEDILAKHSDWIDLQLIRAVGENLGHVREEAELLEVMNKDDMLNRVYMDSNTFLINDAIADVLRQITFKFPRCNILEVGAGTGGTV
jgi:aspyridone synthetase (hybrid polyketide synthase/nonribosomal peptide synthetase)